MVNGIAQILSVENITQIWAYFWNIFNGQNLRKSTNLKT